MKWTLHALRVVFYAMLLHTVVASVSSLNNTLAAPQASGLTSLCQLAGEDISFGSNLQYTLITAENCRALSTDTSSTISSIPA